MTNRSRAISNRNLIVCIGGFTVASAIIFKLVLGTPLVGAQEVIEARPPDELIYSGEFSREEPPYAVKYEDLSPNEKEAVDQTRAWANLPAESYKGFTDSAHRRVAEIKQKTAEARTGLDGQALLGVR